MIYSHRLCPRAEDPSLVPGALQYANIIGSTLQEFKGNPIDFHSYVLGNIFELYNTSRFFSVEIIWFLGDQLLIFVALQTDD